MTEYIIRGFRRPVGAPESLRETLVKRLDLGDIDAVRIEREAIDARRKPNVVYVYSLCFTVSGPSARLSKLLTSGRIALYEPSVLPEPAPALTLPEHPIVVGFGPAGMFLGLWLARMGYRPIIHERGRPVAERIASVEALWSQGKLDPESNMQFGEGGAGTFSDGKLNTGKRSALDETILHTLVQAGGPERILYANKPHVGTDRLRRVVVNIRQEITALGGKVRFGSALTDLHLDDNNAIEAITINGERTATSCVILAIGHSARDTTRMLHTRGVAMVPKPYAIGTRIEHPAALINEAQYGHEAARLLPAADYKLTYRHRGVGVYSFCMCPGGQVVCASSEPGGQVSNGMSLMARDGHYSNSALVVGVHPERMGWTTPMEAVSFQRALEQRAYEAGGGDFVAPAQRAADLIAGRLSASLPETSYRPGVRAGRLDEVLPAEVVEALSAGLQRFDHIMPGFIEKGLLIGVESRTSSPVQLTRDENCCSVSTPGLYLLGEGAGYAGGIMTCIRDAVRFARRVVPRS